MVRQWPSCTSRAGTIRLFARVLALVLTSTLLLNACGKSNYAGPATDYQLSCAAVDSDLAPGEQVCEDSGVRASDLVQFANWGGRRYNGDDFGIEEMVAVFGREAVCAEEATSTSQSCTILPNASIAREKLNAMINGGRCEGMTVLSALYMTSHGPDLTQFNASSVPMLHPQRSVNLVNVVDYWWSSQFLDGTVSHAENIRNSKLEDVLAKVGGSLQRGLGVTLGLYHDGAGHSVLPVAMTSDGPKSYALHVWDPNNPKSLSKVGINLDTKTWRYTAARVNPSSPPEMWSGGSGSIDAVTLAERTGTPDIVDLSSSKGSSSISVSTPAGSSATLTITSTDGATTTITPSGTTGLNTDVHVQKVRDGELDTLLVSVPGDRGKLSIDVSVSRAAGNGPTGSAASRAEATVGLNSVSGETILVGVPLATEVVSVSLIDNLKTTSSGFAVTATADANVKASFDHTLLAVDTRAEESLSLSESSGGVDAVISTSTGTSLTRTVVTSDSVEQVNLERGATGNLVETRLKVESEIVTGALSDLLDQTRQSVKTAADLAQSGVRGGVLPAGDGSATTTTPTPGVPVILSTAGDATDLTTARLATDIFPNRQAVSVSFEVRNDSDDSLVSRKAAAPIVSDGPSINRSVSVTGLLPGIRYKYRTTLLWSDKSLQSDWSYLSIDVPQPRDVTVTPLTRRLKVGWTQLPLPSTAKVTYTANALPNGGTCTVSNASTCEITDVEVGATYGIQVVSTINGKQSQPVKVNGTWTVAGESVDDLAISEITSSSARLSTTIDNGNQPSSVRVEVAGVGSMSASTVTTSSLSANEAPQVITRQFTSLSPATRYTVNVTVSRVGGSSVSKSISFETRPAQPATPTANSGDALIEVSWRQVTAGSGVTVSYIATAEWDGVKSVNQVSPRQPSKSCTTTTTSCVISGLENLFRWKYKVRAVTAGGESPDTYGVGVLKTAGHTPASAVSARWIGGTTVEFVWTIDCANSSNERMWVTSRQAGTTGPVFGWGNIMGQLYIADFACYGRYDQRVNVEYIDVPGLTITTQYQWRVMSIYYENGWQYTPDSSTNTGTFTVPPTPPSNVQVTRLYGSRFDVNWTASSATSGTSVSYTATATPGGASCTTTTTTCRISGLTAGTDYSVSVTATALGASSTSTAVTARAVSSLAISSPTVSIEPAFSSTDTTVGIAYNTNPMEAETTVRIELANNSSMTGATVSSLATIPAGNTSVRSTYTVPSLSPGSQYWVRITAGNESGDTITTTKRIYTLPPAVGTVSHTDAGSTTYLSWPGVTSGTSGTVTYEVRLVPRVSGVFNVTNALATVTSSTTTARVGGLTNGTDYQVSVRAVSPDIAGSYSDPVVATPVNNQPWASVKSVVSSITTATVTVTVNPGGSSSAKVNLIYANNPSFTGYTSQAHATFPTGTSDTDLVFNVSGLAGASRYYYKVTVSTGTYGTANFRDYTSPVTDSYTTPATVATPTLTPAYGQLTVSWTPVSGNETVTYQVVATKNSTLHVTAAYLYYLTIVSSGSCSTTSTTCTITGLTQGQGYDVTVTATTAGASGSPSPAASAWPQSMIPITVKSVTRVSATDWTFVYDLDCRNVSSNLAAIFVRKVGDPWTPSVFSQFNQYGDSHISNSCSGPYGISTLSKTLTFPTSGQTPTLEPGTRYEFSIGQGYMTTSGWNYWNYDSNGSVFFTTPSAAATSATAVRNVSGSVTVTWTPPTVTAGESFTEQVYVYESNGTDTGVRCTPSSAGTCTIPAYQLYPGTFVFRVATSVGLQPKQATMTPTLSSPSATLTISP